jgi:hypothetical protein
MSFAAKRLRDSRNLSARFPWVGGGLRDSRELPGGFVMCWECRRAAEEGCGRILQDRADRRRIVGRVLRLPGYRVGHDAGCPLPWREDGSGEAENGIGDYLPSGFRQNPSR